MYIYGDKARTEALLDYFKNGGETHILLTCRDANNQQIFIRDDDIVSDGGVTISTVMNPDTNLKFGQAVSTEVVAYILKSAKTDSIDWSKGIEVSVSHQLPGEQRNYIPMCNVISTKQQVTFIDGIDVIVMTAYDHMQKLDVIANDFIDSITYPKAFYQLYSDLATYVGIPTYKSLVPPINLTLNENPFPYGCTLRDILRWITEFCGGYAMISHFNNVDRFVQIRMERPGSSVEHILTRDNYYELNKSGVVVPSVPAVELIETQAIEHTSYPSTYTGQPYIIMDNPIYSLCTDAEKLDCLQEYKDNYLDFDSPHDAYIPMKVITPGNPLVEAGDVIDVVDNENNTLPLRIFSRVFHWNGSCTDTYECTGEPEWNMSEHERSTYSADGRIEAIMAVKKDKQEAVTDPTASGTAVQFISNIEQDEQGVVTPQKKTVRTFGAASSGSAGSTGLVPAPASGKQKAYLRGDSTWVVPEIKSYSKAYSNLAAGDSQSFTASQMGFNAPSGKTAFALARFNTGSNSVYVRGVNIGATGGTNAITIVNASDSPKSGTVIIDVTYL